MDAERLHPCPGCGHESMDECWAAGAELPAKGRRLCRECHDECLPRVRRAPAPNRRANGSGEPADLPKLLFARARRLG